MSQEIQKPAVSTSPARQGDPTFDFAPFEEKAPHRLSRGFWLQWCALLGIGFAMLSLLAGGFANMREYGWTETGINRVLLLSKHEKLFGLGLLAMLPLVLFLVIGTERSLAGPVRRAAAWVVATTRRRGLAVLALVVVAGAAIFATGLFVMHNEPVTDDEGVYLFQTRILAAGHLTLPSLPDEEPLRDRLFEDNVFLVNNGKIFGQYPLGQSLVLLPGYLAGYPRAVPLALALASLIAMYLLGARLYGPRLGLLATALLAVSPTFLGTAATLLSHTATLCFLMWFFYFAHRTWRERHWLNALAAGVFFFAAFQVRSTTTLLVAGPAGIALAIALLRNWRREWAKIAVLAVLVGLTLAATFYVNYQINGDIFKTNYHAAWGEGKTPFKHPFGFGKGAWHMVHSPEQGAWSFVDNLLRLNWWLLGWPVGLIFVVAWLLRRDKTGVEWLGFAAVALTFAAYFFYFWPGVSETGPVLYFELTGPLILLTVSGIAVAPRLLLAWMPRQVAAGRVALFVLFSCLVAFATFHQFQARALERVAESGNELGDALKSYGVPEEAVVFTNYYLKDTPDYHGQDSWVVGRPFTSRLLGDRRLFYINYGRERDEQFMAKYHPGVPAYVVSWSAYGHPEVTSIENYTVMSLPDNFPDSR